MAEKIHEPHAKETTTDKIKEVFAANQQLVYHLLHSEGDEPVQEVKPEPVQVVEQRTEAEIKPIAARLTAEEPEKIEVVHVEQPNEVAPRHEFMIDTTHTNRTPAKEVTVKQKELQDEAA